MLGGTGAVHGIDEIVAGGCALWSGRTPQTVTERAARAAAMAAFASSVMGEIAGQTANILAPAGLLHGIAHMAGGRVLRALSTERGQIRLDMSGHAPAEHFGRPDPKPDRSSAAGMVPSLGHPNQVASNEQGRDRIKLKFGAHTPERHVGKSATFLQDRLKRNSAASSFATQEDAECAVSAFLEAQGEEVTGWRTAAKKGHDINFDHYFPYDIGMIVTRTHPEPCMGRRLGSGLIAGT